MLNVAGYSDERLLHLLKADDRQAYTEIYTRYWEELFCGAFKRLKDREQCQDIVQIVLSDLWRRRKELAINDLPAYLHSAVRYQVFRQISKKPLNCEFLDGFEVFIASTVRADDGLIEKEMVSLVRLWVNSLPGKRRAIFLMYVEEELSTHDIAIRLGISQKTVQNQLTNAVNMLKMRLAQFLMIFLFVAAPSFAGLASITFY